MIFVALGTLTGSYAADRLARGWYYLGGQNGIPSIPPMTLGSYEIDEGPVYYYLALGILVVVYLCCRFLVRSQFGLVLAGIREHEQRIAFFGYRVQHFKAIIFSLAGAIAGLAGSLYAFHEGFVWPEHAGRGHLDAGRALRAVRRRRHADRRGDRRDRIEACQLLAVDSYQDIWPIILGVLLLLVILFRPTGLISLDARERERVGNFGRAAEGERRPWPCLRPRASIKIFGKLTALTAST